MRTVRERNVTPHITKNDKNRSSNLDRRTTRQPGYAIQPEPPLADLKRQLWVVEANWIRFGKSGCADWRRVGLAVSCKELRRAQPDPASQTHRSTTSHAPGTVRLNPGFGHRDRINEARKTG